MKLVRLIANLGYGSRKEVFAMLREARVTSRDGTPLDPDARMDHADILFDGDELDPPSGLVLMLNKPLGHTCSTSDPGQVVYDLLPERFRWRKPTLASVGRLDRDTSGLLLMTDDGALLHRITSPRSHLPKVYEATLAEALRGDEADLFASGALMLKVESSPLAAAKLEALAPKRARVTILEGRYHQIRRMFAAVGNHVEALHRTAVGGLTLGDLGTGEWRRISEAEIASIFLSIPSPPSQI